MASRPGFRRRAEAGPVEGLKFSTSGGMLGGAARIPTLCQGLSPQKGHSEDQHTFNSLRRDSFLTVATFKTPGVYNLLWQAYSSQTRSFFDEDEFFSETGLSPIGPAFFALLVDEAVRGVKSELNVWYSDDATLGDYPERVHDDLVVLLERLRAIGLEVNGSKCELCNKALRSVFSQAVGRCLRGSREGELHPIPYFVPEGILSSKSMLDNFLNHIEQESKNCDGILNEMQNLIIFQLSVIQFCLFQLTNYY